MARQRASSGLLAGRPHFWHTASAGGAMKLLPQKLHLILAEATRVAERDDDEDFDFLDWEGSEIMMAALKTLPTPDDPKSNSPALARQK